MTDMGERCANASVLVVDDEQDFARGLVRLIRAGFPDLRVDVTHSGLEALEELDRAAYGLVLLDLNMPGMHGLQVLPEILKKDPDISVIVLTAHGTVESAVNALKNGAADFLAKPVRQEDLFRAVGRGCERYRLLGENRRLRTHMLQSEMGRSLIGESQAMRQLKSAISAVAASQYTVLIRGESGTGKELVARTVHGLSERRDGPYLCINCAAIPEQLLESELFGHVQGAFTGAVKARKGLFLEASNGTLVLDEVGSMPPAVQAKLLRVLQDGEIRPLGSEKSARVDTRVLAVTNEDLEGKIQAGLFREDLFYRLNVLCLTTPPLRACADDIPLLAAHFLAQSCRETRMEAKSFSPDAMALLCRRNWPGNVRELQNFIRRLAVFCNSSVVECGHLHAASGEESARAFRSPCCELSYAKIKERLLEDFTRHYLNELLSRSKGNITEAARLSGLKRSSLQKIIARMGIRAERFRGE